jgi:signal peptidase II
MKFYKHKLIILFFIVLLVFLDQITKYFIYNLHYFENSNFVFNTLNEWISWWINLIHFNILVILLPIILGFVFYLFLKKQISTLWFILVFSWWLWNFIDRITLFWVRDFIKIPEVFSYQFPIFNVADIFVTIWFFVIIYQIIKEDKF